MTIFAGKTALVTGAATGLGRALAEELGRRGAVVYVSALTQAEAEPVAENIRQSGAVAHAIKLDVREIADIESAMDQICAANGRLDYVFNNAGIVFIGEFREMRPTQIENLIATNFTGPSLIMLCAFQRMRAQGGGHIVNTASHGGLMPVATMAMYSGTKHGIVGLSTSLRAEAAPDNVRISTICMGFVESSLIRSADKGEGADKGIAAILPIKPWPAARAADRVLRGVVRNEPLILFPVYVKLAWWLHRISPWLSNWMIAKSFETYCKARS